MFVWNWKTPINSKLWSKSILAHVYINMNHLEASLCTGTYNSSTCQLNIIN